MQIKHKSLILFALLVLVDQILKVYIKTTMTIGESYEIFSWFKIVFIENPGMAFGFSFGSKYFLTAFRVLFSAVIFYYLLKLYKAYNKDSYIYVITLVLAGAIGNIIDCMFYGIGFGESTFYEVATFMPAEGGYAPFMLGKVVDMFYFPLFTIPDWVPMFGGEIFFSPVFNLADSYITVSLFAIIIFFRKDFNDSFEMVLSKRDIKRDND